MRGAGLALVLGALSACGGAPDDLRPPRPATVSLDTFATADITVALNFSGSATLGSDYAVSDEAVTVPARGYSATVEIDIYRDFDDDGDETIEVSLGAITGTARAGDQSTVTLTILDGQAVTMDTPADDDEMDSLMLGLLPLAYTVTEDAVVLTVVALNFRPTGETVPLVAEWSTDLGFQTDVRLIGRVDVESALDSFALFLGNLHVFTVPLSELAPDRVYFVRAYLGEEPPPAAATRCSPSSGTSAIPGRRRSRTAPVWPAPTCAWPVRSPPTAPVPA